MRMILTVTKIPRELDRWLEFDVQAPPSHGDWINVDGIDHTFRVSRKQFHFDPSGVKDPYVAVLVTPEWDDEWRTAASGDS
jgi:hypothetical protein